MQRTWAAVHRRPEHADPIQHYYTQCFGALASIQEPLPSGVVIPDTFVFTHSGWQWYTFSTAQRKVVLKPAVSCTSQRIIEHCTQGRLPGGVRQPLATNQDDEDDQDELLAGGNDIVAVWYTDRRDSRGLLTAVEYFNADALERFFVTGERKKLGVLQQFIYPRPVQLEDEVNQELLLHWNPVESVVVERRFGKNKFDSVNPASGELLHPTQRALVHPPVQTAGKITCLTNPFQQNDIKTIGEGLAMTTDGGAFEHHAGTLCDHVATALESMRTLSGTKEGRGVSSLSLAAKFSRDGGFLFLLGVTNLRFPGDHENRELTFDVIPPRTGLNALGKYIPPNRAAMPAAQGEFEVQTSIPASYSNQPKPSSTQHQKSSPTPSSGHHHHHHLLEEEDDGAADSLLDPYEEDDGAGSYDDEFDGGSSLGGSKGKLYDCPNCGARVEKSDMLPVPYKNLVNSMEKENKATKGGLSKMIPPAAPKVSKNRKHGDPPPKRPKSARVAASFERVRQIDTGAACYQTKTYSRWTEVPPVLKKLNITVEQIKARPIWLNRTICLCNVCAAKFGVEKPDPLENEDVEGSDAATPSPTRSGDGFFHNSPSTAATRRKSRAKPLADRLDSTGIADRMVLTDLQKYHRDIRRTERDKKEMRDVIDEVKAGTQKGRDEEQDLKEIAASLGALCIPDSSPVTAGSSPDLPLSVMLMNELYGIMSSICGKPLDDGEGDIPIVLQELGNRTTAQNNNTSGGGAPSPTQKHQQLPAGAALLNAPFKKPAVLMDVRGLDEITVRAERETHSGAPNGRKLTMKTLIVNSEANTMSRLKEVERRLVIEVVGVDRDRPLDDGAFGGSGTGGNEDDEELPY